MTFNIYHNITSPEFTINQPADVVFEINHLVVPTGDFVKSVTSTDNHIVVDNTDPKNPSLSFQLVDNENLLTDDQLALVATITNKVDKLTGYSLVADSEILKIHARNTDSTLLSENGEHTVFLDNSGVLHVS